MKKIVYQVVSGQNVLGEFYLKDYAIIFVEGLLNKVDQLNPNFSVSIIKSTTEIEEKPIEPEVKKKK